MAEESTSETPPGQSIAHPKCFSKFELYDNYIAIYTFHRIKPLLTDKM